MLNTKSYIYRNYLSSSTLNLTGNTVIQFLMITEVQTSKYGSTTDAKTFKFLKGKRAKERGKNEQQEI